MTFPVDAPERRRALDPEKSFIVQAPAGSGKTELLIQRYLGLLARVKHPEEILAITFTRKAAAEMRNRVLAAIAGAAENTPAGEDHEILTRELASRARQRDLSENWRMEKYPSRMRIMTIDSLCASLVRQMPVLSGFGAPAGIAEDPAALYSRAARDTVAELEGGENRSESLETLVRHLDNRPAVLENLIASMLPRRDQWLRHAAHDGDSKQLRNRLESAIESVVSRALLHLRSRFPSGCIRDTLQLCRFAAKNLKEDGIGSCISDAGGLGSLPGKDPQDLPAWQGIAELLLTKDGQWRKAVNKNVGFPSAGSAGANQEKRELFEHNKARFKKLVATLSENPELAAALHSVRRLPSPAYTEDQWAVLEALIEILKLSAAHLQTVFANAGKVDFAETAIRARAALGEPDNPTELALSMDYRISHILIDEFQDTSISQYELMRGLAAGWTPGDGRTFFAVGDPMQSVYGFREAEVGLFLKAWESGLDAHIPLEQVVLRSNFRSDRGIVEWVNQAFSQVLPEKGNPDTGAVPYMPSEPVADYGTDRAVRIHPMIEADDEQEASCVTECVKQAMAEEPAHTIGILVRSRPHLKAIVPELRRAGLRFSAVEIDSLAERPLVRDLLSLTRALSHPADRAAWLAVLRAPWCGLSLKDLYILAGRDHKSCIYSLMRDEDIVLSLSEDGRKRLLKARPVLDTGVQQRGRRSLRRLVEGVWLGLGGPAAAADYSELADVSVYLDYLESYSGPEVIADIEAFEKGVFSLFAAPDPGADPRLQIMTIHKAKGLEFDTVIIPGLGKSPRNPELSLLLWQELADLPAEESLLMAPISETGAQNDSKYSYIYRLQQIRTDYETGRLLYVAATRASKRLHLFASVNRDRSGAVSRPDSRSLLGILWPAVSGEFEKAAEDAEPEDNEHRKGKYYAPSLFSRRLPVDWRLPELPGDVSSAGAGKISRINQAASDTYMPGFDWAGLTLRRVGTVVHRWLKIICEQGLENWSKNRVEETEWLLRTELFRAGVCGSDTEEAVLHVLTALSNAVSDETGRWILSARGTGACEFAVSGVLDNRFVNVLVDRTFVDRHGVRWVIDYKSGLHSGGGLSDFLDREQHRYGLQMETYVRLLKRLDGRRVSAGLYFPMIPAWRKWEPNV